MFINKPIISNNVHNKPYGLLVRRLLVENCEKDQIIMYNVQF